MDKIFLGLGSDLGDRMENLSEAVRIIGKVMGRVSGLSFVYESEPWGFSSGTRFLNMAIEVDSEISPAEMMERIIETESLMGRRRGGKGYESRIIDIDILFFGGMSIREGNLVVPHPLVHARRFVLVPMNDIAPSFIHPVSGKSISELLLECSDPGSVTRYA